MFNKLETHVLSKYKRSRAAPSTFYTLIKQCFSFIKHYININININTAIHFNSTTRIVSIIRALDRQFITAICHITMKHAFITLAFNSTSISR